MQGSCAGVLLFIFCCTLLQRTPLPILLSFKESRGSHGQVIRTSVPSTLMHICRPVLSRGISGGGENRSRSEVNK